LIDAKQITLSPIGPSFDCRKANEPIGLLLCADQELMHLDALMGHLYRYARHLDRSAEQVTLQSQRAWIKKRLVACPTGEGDGYSLEKDRTAARCLSELTMLRMDELLEAIGRPRLDFSKLLEYGRDGWAIKR
jgi:uncharacterized protein YecT (DUF1311 family)